MPVTDGEEDLDKGLFTRDLETVKCINWNNKFNKNNEEVLASLDSGSERNSIFQEYKAQLLLKIINASWRLAKINKQKISKQKKIIIGFEITNNVYRTRYFEATFLIADILPLLISDISFLKMKNLDVSWTACIIQWGQWNVEAALTSTNWVDIIDHLYSKSCENLP